MTSDLIRRDTLLENAYMTAPATMVNPYGGDYVVSVEDIENAPTVDAVEVVHGRWEHVDNDGSWRVDMCSICHRRMHYVDYDQPYQYCPNCGAMMDLPNITDQTIDALMKMGRKAHGGTDSEDA